MKYFSILQMNNKIPLLQSIPAKKMWSNLRTPFRKMELERICGGSGDKRSGAEGQSIQEKANSWAYYDKMSFMRTYIYTKE